MRYGDEYAIVGREAGDLASLGPTALSRLFADGEPVSRFNASGDCSFINDREAFGEHTLCFRVRQDAMLEINNMTLAVPMAIRNEVADLISFQFVSRLRRAELLGRQRHVHAFGPALIVTAIPGAEVTYRIPEVGVPIRHVAVFTTLSTLLARMSELPADYPGWLVELLDGSETRTQQRVFFLEDIYREPIWSCFNLPVSGSLLGPWLTAKYEELVCLGLQILKNSGCAAARGPLDHDLPYGEKIRKARDLLSMEYASPPSLPELARTLGISETQLKIGFKAMHGTTILQYCINMRIEAARILLKESHHTISEIGDLVGYEDHSAFSRAFRRLSGCSPQEWRRTWAR